MTIHHIGRTYHHLTILEEAGKTPAGATLFRCRCSCGKEKVARKDNILHGRTKSCGCLNKKRTKPLGEGEYHSNLHLRYNCMKTRCYQPSHKSYPNYSGRGIKVCAEWRHDYKAFAKWARANGYKRELTLDRIDVDGDYSPENCRWVSVKDQANNRRTNAYITYQGVTKTARQWSEEANIIVSYDTILSRRRAGQTGEEIFGDRSNIPRCNRRKARLVTIGEESHSLKDWATQRDIAYSTLRMRYHRGVRGAELLVPVAPNAARS